MFMRPGDDGGKGADMLIGYCRVSKADGSQSAALQRDALITSGVGPDQIYEDRVSGVTTERPGLDSCLKALRGHAEGQVGAGDILVTCLARKRGKPLRRCAIPAALAACPACLLTFPALWALPAQPIVF